MAQAMAESPATSFPKVFTEDADLEGAYRFFNNRRINPESILRPHVMRTIERVGKSDSVLAIHDSTLMAYRASPDCPGEAHQARSRALAADLFYATEGRVWTAPTESPEVGETLTFRVYVGAEAPVVAVSPYVMDAFWSWTDTWNTAVAEDGWTTVSVVVPPWATTPLNQIGVKIYMSQPYTGSFYVDAVEW
jgi:hypothetical protein